MVHHAPHAFGAARIGTDVIQNFLPLPLREGVGGRGAYNRYPRLFAPLPPTPSLKGRGKMLI